MREYPDRPFVGVLAVLPRRCDDGVGRVLLARRSHRPNAGLWGFPGGVVELGETLFQAAARELMEETGVSAEPESFLTALDVLRPDPDGRVRYHFALIAVRLRWISGEGIAADDADEVLWASAEDLLSAGLAMSPQVAEIGVAVLDGMSTPAT